MRPIAYQGEGGFRAKVDPCEAIIHSMSNARAHFFGFGVWRSEILHIDGTGICFKFMKVFDPVGALGQLGVCLFFVGWSKGQADLRIDHAGFLCFRVSVI